MSSYKKIKQIDLVFENCEVVQISYDNIYSMYIYLNGRSIDIPWGWKEGAFSDTLLATSVYINLFDLDKMTYLSFGNERRNLLKRLQCPDITHIDIIYEDDTNEYIAVPWKNKSQYSSIYQTVNKTNDTYNDKTIWKIAITKRGLFRRNWRLFKEAITEPKWFIKQKYYNFKYTFCGSYLYIMYIKVCNFIYDWKHPEDR